MKKPIKEMANNKSNNDEDCLDINIEELNQSVDKKLQDIEQKLFDIFITIKNAICNGYKISNNKIMFQFIKENFYEFALVKYSPIFKFRQTEIIAMLNGTPNCGTMFGTYNNDLKLTMTYFGINNINKWVEDLLLEHTYAVKYLENYEKKLKFEKYNTLKNLDELVKLVKGYKL